MFCRTEIALSWPNIDAKEIRKQARGTIVRNVLFLIERKKKLYILDMWFT